MELTATVAGKAYRVDLGRPLSLAIPLRFDGPQPNFFGAPAASARPWRAEGFVGDTRQGGGCNVAALSLVPHCNGTHTETAGHVLDADHPVFVPLAQSLMPALLVSVTPVQEENDSLITREALSAAIGRFDFEAPEALIVRTLPNDPAKTEKTYADDDPPPFFTAEAMRDLADRGIRHLLVDIPSIDRMHDGGRLANHRIFWNLPEGTHDPAPGAWLDRTVTEMIFVPDDIADGRYLLNLQAPAFATHAAPSRPVLYPLVS